MSKLIKIEAYKETCVIEKYLTGKINMAVAEQNIILAERQQLDWQVTA